jgi:hypothetical protein
MFLHHPAPRNAPAISGTVVTEVDEFSYSDATVCRTNRPATATSRASTITSSHVVTFTALVTFTPQVNLALSTTGS